MRDDLVRVEEQVGEKRLLLAPVQRDRPVLADDLEWAEDAELQRRPPEMTVAPALAGA